MVKKCTELYLKITKWTENLLFILSVFTFLFFIYKDFGIRMIYGFALLAFIVMLFVLRILLLRRAPKFSTIKTVFFVLIVLITFFVLKPGARHDDDIRAYLFAMVIGGAVLVFAEPSKREIQLTFRFITVTATLLSAYILFFSYFQGLYFKTAWKLLSKTTQDLAKHYIPRGYGVPVGSYTYPGYYIMLALPITLGRLLICRKRLSVRIADIVASYIMLLALFVEGRRGELLGGLGACLLIFICSVEFRIPRKIVRRCISLILVILTVVLLVIGLNALGMVERYASTLEILAVTGYDPYEAHVDRPDSAIKDDITIPKTSTGMKEISSGRFELWDTAWTQFKEHPVTGIGWGRFADHVTEAFKKQHGAGGVDNILYVHNTFLELLCETGIVGTVLIFIPILYFLFAMLAQAYRLRRLRNKPDNYEFVSLLNLASIGTQSFLFAIGMLDTTFYHTKFWLFYDISLIFAIAALWEEKDVEKAWLVKKGERLWEIVTKRFNKVS